MCVRLMSRYWVKSKCVRVGVCEAWGEGSGGGKRGVSSQVIRDIILCVDLF